MKLLEAIELLNDKGLKVQEVADQLGISKDLLADLLKEQGYIFNNKTKSREYIGGEEPSNINLEELISLRKRNRGKRQSSTKTKPYKINQVQKSNEQPLPGAFLTEQEIQTLKEIASSQEIFIADFEINYQFSQLPAKNETKKASYEISLETYKSFDKFAKKVGSPRRISRNDMVEMALHYYMNTFKDHS